MPGTFRSRSLLSAIFALTALSHLASAATVNLTVQGTDAIFLAGRTDVTIAPPGPAPAGYPLVRRSPAGPAAETSPQSVQATGGQSFQFSATGTIDVNVLNPTGPKFGPETSYSANLNAVGAISGYIGPAAALVGVFLTDASPATGTAPARISFSGNTAFTSLAPGIGQVFFIGDGLTGTGTGTRQTFFAPAGATRLFLGIPDGAEFVGTPGNYDDNAGSFAVTISTPAPLPPAALAALPLLAGLAMLRLKSRR